MEKRIGFIGIIVNEKSHVKELNDLLSQYGHLIVGRMGVPRHGAINVIALIIEGSNDEIGALTENWAVSKHYGALSIEQLYNHGRMLMKQNFFSVLEKAKTSSALTPEDLVTLLSATEEQIPQLMAAADAVRLQTVGNQVHLRGIIEFSSYCSQRCCYCGLRADNKKIQRYRLTPEQILDTARAAVETGYRTLVLQSGEDTFFQKNAIAELINRNKKNGLCCNPILRRTQLRNLSALAGGRR